jgi:HEAT repeat protein
MAVKRLGVIAVLCGLLIGCGKAQPTLSGGKPVEHWVQALKNPDARVRKEAASKLGNAGAANSAVLPALVTALKDPDAKVRCEVILALVKFGPDANEAVPILTELQKSDSDARVRTYAGEALEKIQKGR